MPDVPEKWVEKVAGALSARFDTEPDPVADARAALAAIWDDLQAATLHAAAQAIREYENSDATWVNPDRLLDRYGDEPKVWAKARAPIDEGRPVPEVLYSWLEPL